MRYIAVIASLFLLSCAQVSFERTENGLNGFFSIKEKKSVSVYVSTDGYAEHRAVLDGSVWRAELPYSERFTAFFTADGRPFLPECPMKEFDDFGSQLCVYEEE